MTHFEEYDKYGNRLNEMHEDLRILELSFMQECGRDFSTEDRDFLNELRDSIDRLRVAGNLLSEAMEAAMEDDAEERRVRGDLDDDD